MKTLERIQKLSDLEALNLYERVSRVVSGAIDVDTMEVQASNAFGISVDTMQEVDIPADQAIPLVRESLKAWADDRDLASMIDNFLDNPIKIQGVALILSLGTVLVTTLANLVDKAEIQRWKMGI